VYGLRSKGFASSSGKQANFIPPMLEQSSNWSNLHAGPDFVEAGAYAPVRRDAHAEVERINDWLHTSPQKSRESCSDARIAG